MAVWPSIACIAAASEAIYTRAVAVAVVGAAGADVDPIDGPLLGVVSHREVTLVPTEPNSAEM